MSKTGKNAYLTVYLSLILAVMLSLCLALIEGVRSSAVYMEAECVTDIGLNSILAEYHRELLKQYNLFAIDASYGTSSPRVTNTERHLTDYLEKNLSCESSTLNWLVYKDFLGLSLESAEITKVSILTDGEGAVFKRRAAEAVWDDMGLNLYQELAGWMNIVEINELAERDIGAEKRAFDEQLAGYNGKEVKIAEEEWVTVKVENPTDILEQKRREGILKQVVKDTGALSSQTMDTGNLISARMAAGVLNQGNVELEEISGAEQLLEQFFFHEYLLRYMDNYRNQSGKGALNYQVEYLLSGKDNDIDNLRGVANSLCAIREVSNVIYLFADQEKRNTAKLAATGLAALLWIPEAADVIEQVILFGWAFAESLHDVECLLDGKRVPLMKNSDTWYYDLESALGFKKGGDSSEGTGLSYEDYLRILLMLKKEDHLTVRAMNMIEANIRKTPGNDAFRLDGCCDGVESCVRITSDFGYDCEIKRQKSYKMQ